MSLQGRPLASLLQLFSTSPFSWLRSAGDSTFVFRIDSLVSKNPGNPLSLSYLAICGNCSFPRALCWLVVWVCLSQFSRSVMSDSLRLHGLQHARLPCPSPTPGAYSNSCPSSRWCHLTISSSVVPFSSHLQSFPASGLFQ